MERPEIKYKHNNVNKVKTFSVEFALEEIKENIYIPTDTHSKSSKEQIIQQAFDLLLLFRLHYFVYS